MRGAMTAEDAAAARVEAAAALRALTHALVGRDAPAGLLRDIAQAAGELRARLDGCPARRRPADGMARDLARPRPAEGDAVEHFADCPVSGAASPLSIPLMVRRDGDGVVCDFTLGPGWEGAPGRSHGGAVAAIFDDAFGFVTQVARVPSYAGELAVRFVRPAPIGEPLRLSARATRRDGRRLHLEGTLCHRETVVATARGVNIHVMPDRLGRPGYEY